MPIGGTEAMKKPLSLFVPFVVFVACGEDVTSRFVPAADSVQKASQESSSRETLTIPFQVDCASLLADFISAVKIQNGMLVRAGESQLADVVLPNVPECPITTSIVGADGAPPSGVGTLPEPLKYVAPQNVEKDVEIAIKVLFPGSEKLSDLKIPVKLLSPTTIFVPDDGRWNGAAANVYRIPIDTLSVPNFDVMTPFKQVVSANIDVPARNWQLGVPGLDGLNEWFGIRYAFDLLISEAGTYSFAVNSDDGSILTLDGVIVVRNDGQHAPKQVAMQQPVVLASGRHALRLDYFQGPRDFLQVQLLWKKPGQTAFDIVPASAFRKKVL